MFEHVNEEVDNVDEHITHIMFSMCQECRFMAAMRVIDSIDKDFIGELHQYAKDRLNDSLNQSWSSPLSEPKHRGGGCYVCI
jgi:hypothetical protein